MSHNYSGNGSIPPMIKGISLLVGTLGIPTFLLLWTNGAFGTFLPAPVEALIRQHDERMIAVIKAESVRSTRLHRFICAGLWKDQPAVQAKCWIDDPEE